MKKNYRSANNGSQALLGDREEVMGLLGSFDGVDSDLNASIRSWSHTAQITQVTQKRAVKSRISILWLLKCINGRGNNRREREQKEETNHFWSQPERKDQKWAHDESGSQWCVLQWHPTTPDLPQTVGWWCQGTPHHRALQDRSVIKTDKPFNQISRKVDEEESEKRKKRK